MEKNQKQSHLKVLFSYAGKFKYLTVASWLFSALSALTALVPFVYIWRIVRDVLAAAPHYAAATRVGHDGWMAVAFSLLSIALYICALMCSHVAAFRIASNIRIRCMRHILTLPLGFMDDMGSGRLRKTVNEASAATETYLAHQLPDHAGSIATPIGLVLLLFFFDWKLGLLSLIPVVLAYAIMFVFMTGPSMKKAMTEYQQALDRMSNEAVEYVRGIPVVKTFGQTVFSFKKFKAAIDDYQQWVIGYTRHLQLPMTAYTTIINSIFAVLIAATLFVMAGHGMTDDYLLNLIYYVIITPIITVTLTRIMYLSENNLIVGEALGRIDEVLAMQPLEEPRVTQVPNNNSVTLKHVSFSYPGAARNALNDVSMHIGQGEHVALVGPSGSGKTTLASLMARFWDVADGSIEIGGVDVRYIGKDMLVRHISFVFQDSRLLKTSILENVRLGRPSATETEVMEVLHRAQCDDIIAKLPDGLYTIIGSKGIYLSGGEQQRIAIARVMLQDTPVVILDEATAFADPDNEQKVQAAFNEMGKGKTVVMIAHRLSTVTGADRIYVLSDGQICEQGTHQQLTAMNDGLYKRMWNEYNESVKWSVGGKK